MCFLCSLSWFVWGFGYLQGNQLINGHLVVLHWCPGKGDEANYPPGTGRLEGHWAMFGVGDITSLWGTQRVPVLLTPSYLQGLLHTLVRWGVNCFLRSYGPTTPLKARSYPVLDFMSGTGKSISFIVINVWLIYSIAFILSSIGFCLRKNLIR